MKARQHEQQNAAMDEYIKNPTKKNKQKYKKLGVTEGMLEAYRNGEEYVTDIGFFENIFSSSSRIAEKVQLFRAFYTWGDRAQKKIIQLRDR